MCFEFIFSGDLYHARKKHGWSQQKVAEMIAISVREYQNIERGRVTPHLKTFLRLVFLFDLDIELYREVLAVHVPVSSR